jgi:hypothetical protein
MTITESHAATAPASWQGRTAFGWVRTSPVIAGSAPLPYLTTSLVDVAQEQSDFLITRNEWSVPSPLTWPEISHEPQSEKLKC